MTTQLRGPDRTATGPAEPGRNPFGPPARKARPVVWFATLGGALLVLQAYVYGRWLLAGPRRTPTGPDPVPDWMRVVVHLCEIGAIVGWVIAVYFFIVRPWRRKRPVPLVGILIAAFLTVEWQDLLCNYFNHAFTYNAAVFNFGAWYSYIPGWTSPRADHIAEGIGFVTPMWSLAMLLPAILIADLMRRTRVRWPRIGTTGLLGVALLAGMVTDVIIEPLFNRLGVYVFAGTIPSLTLWPGRYYQFPIYEAPILGACFAAFASLLYFRDDKGRTIAERGIDTLRVGRTQAGVVRFLALSGFLNAVMLGYAVLYVPTTLMPSFTFAKDVVDRSYFRNELCGPGTTYACPGADVPIPRRGGTHVGPDGQLHPG